MAVYKVVRWGEIAPIKSFNNLKKAKKYCRSLGYDPNLISGNLKWYAPIAYVADENGLLVYNPRFKIN